MIGRTLAAKRSAAAPLASRARWRALARFGLPRRLPRERRKATEELATFLIANESGGAQLGYCLLDYIAAREIGLSERRRAW
jgi:hypothetical protein